MNSDIAVLMKCICLVAVYAEDVLMQHLIILIYLFVVLWRR